MINLLLLASRSRPALAAFLAAALLLPAASPPAGAQNAVGDKKAVKLDPRANCSGKAKLLLDQAWEAQPQNVSTNDRDPQKAADLYREALKDSPQCLLALGMISSLLQRDEKYEQAYGYNELLLGIHPNHTQALLAKANLLSVWKKDYQQALKLMAKVLALDGPGNGSAHYSIAATFSLMNNPDDSLKNLKLAMAIDPGWGDGGNAQTDDDFKNLREDPRFWELVKKPAK